VTHESKKEEIMSVLLEERDGATVVLTLNRPDKLNALNLELITAIDRKFAELENDKSIRAIILTGAGDKAFAAGADIAAMQNMTPVEAKKFAELGHRAGARMEAIAVPVIAAVNGFALGGGCELALACDFIYASEKAKFGQPEVNLGVIPGFGGTQRLLRRVGAARARELCYTGNILTASDALLLGLVNLVVPHAELLAKAKATAALIGSKGPLAIAGCKQVIAKGEDVPLAVANQLEVSTFAGLFGSHDQKEGMVAFTEKRAAAFKGE
jgi:enoyl-CoA hydratase